VELAERALTMGPGDQSFTLQLAESNLDLAIALHARGEYRRTIDVLTANLRALEEPTFYRRYRMASFYVVISRTILAWTWAQLGDFQQGLVTAQAGVVASEESRHPYSAANANFGIGCVYAAQGKLGDAIARLDIAVAVCRRAEIPALFPFPASLLGYAYALAGAAADALPLVSEAVEKAAAMRLNCHQALRTAHLAEAHLLSGDLGRARVHAYQALDLSQRHAERGNEASCLRVLGRICARQDPADVAGAHEHYSAALALASELGMRPLIAHCHLGLGQLQRRTDPPAAQKHLTAAVTMYREMEMPFWLNKAD
jgi:tetratricopeptide (TPR) repeat protein